MESKKSFASYLALLCGFLVLFIIFLPMLETKENSVTFKGFEIVFGCDDEDMFGFSILNMLAYLFPFLGGIFAFNSKKAGKIFGILLFIAGGILLFFSLEFIKPNPDFLEYGDESDIKEIYQEFLEIGIGVKCGGVISILGVLFTGIAFYMENRNEDEEEYYEETQDYNEEEKIEILKKYKTLLDNKIITQEEFNQKKYELLKK